MSHTPDWTAEPCCEKHASEDHGWLVKRDGKQTDTAYFLSKHDAHLTAGAPEMKEILTSFLHAWHDTLDESTEGLIHTVLQMVASDASKILGKIE